MFLIIGIVVITIMVMLKTSLSLGKQIENKRYLEQGLEREQFKNIKREVINAVDIAYFNSSNMTRNAEDFLRFVRRSMKATTVDFNALVVESIFPNVTADVETMLNVTALNLLGVEIRNLTLTFNSSARSFLSREDGAIIETDFRFNTSSDFNSSLTIFYLTAYENRTENVSIPIEIGKSKFIGFFDLRLVTSGQEQRDSFTKTYTLP